MAADLQGVAHRGQPEGRRAGRPALLPRMHVEEIVRVASHLGPRDRALVRAVYERGLPLKAIALINQCSARRLQSRLRRIIRRMRSPLFLLVLREREHWPADRRSIAQAVVLEGRGQRETARELGISLHAVRMEVEHLKALAGVERIASST